MRGDTVATNAIVVRDISGDNYSQESEKHDTIPSRCRHAELNKKQAADDTQIGANAYPRKGFWEARIQQSTISAIDLGLGDPGMKDKHDNLKR